MKPNRRQAWKCISDHSIAWLNHIMLPVFLKRYPRMSCAAHSSDHETSVVTHIQKLPPSPQREIVAIPFLCFFKMLWRLPVIVLPKLLFIGHTAAFPQKFAHIANRLTFHREGLA